MLNNVILQAKSAQEDLSETKAELDGLQVGFTELLGESLGEQERKDRILRHS